MVDLIPVDHDPFADQDPSAPMPDQGHGLAGVLSSAWQNFAGGPESYLARSWRGLQEAGQGIGEAFTGAARAGLQRQAELLSPQTAAQPFLTVNPQTGEYVGRLPALAEFVTSAIAGPVPGGALGAGPAILRRGTALDAPISDTARAAQFAEDLRAQHLAGDDPLPLSGAKQPVSPPPHIQSMDDMNGLVGRYSDLAETGRTAREWYANSGRAILQAAGEPEAADRFAAALAVSSPRTDVAGNAANAVTLWNQAMVGEPVLAVGGRGGLEIGQRAVPLLYQGAPMTGEKTGPFHTALSLEWNPDPAGHPFVNDVWNMRAAEYPPELGSNKTAAQYDGSPTVGQHNFTRILADRVATELEARNPGETWTPEQVQAAVWAAKKAQVEGTPIGAAALDFAGALKNRVAQQSWESAPGQTSGNLPEYHQADPATQQAYHDAIRAVLEDDQGNDLISRHMGLPNVPSFQGPGVFEGAVRPGSQAQSLAGAPLQGGYLAGTDQATKDLFNASEATRGLLLRQDASAWHFPQYRPSLKPGDSNLVDVDIGRTLTSGEAQNMVETMKNAAGTDWFSPIATPRGFRFWNDPEASGVTNVDFQKHVDRAVNAANLPEDATLRPGFATGGYITNDWRKQPNGQGYLETITRTGRPDLERRAAEILATLGPRVSQIENDFAAQHGWTPDPGTRVWETSPQIAQYGLESGLTRPRPWATGPGSPRSSQPPLLVPVEHDPFSGGAVPVPPPSSPFNPAVGA